ncbi:SGNH/GDSL hydrolase family protein [Oculatella sp. LEGE 06141]|uniref:SGNH/GDSL hydrolase family protein n=1 Tax=Oculatella sp. LEGE 06141 TaxID=1828648 RepID=UPI0018803DE3|nr:SGNH/GDSL hydrolase family protein [Oculatella sp. LEGE 06141]MBE9181385.1 SGNH/GDSL hydrolase family protein [Oculatella sp. LEGE 06141]
MKLHVLLGSGLVFLSSLWPLGASALAEPPVDRVYVFGDSLSDTGNVFRVTNRQAPPSPPYFEGRYSNGPVWPEYLIRDLGLTSDSLTDFAFGGATTGTTNNSSSISALVGLQQQIDRFTATTSDPDPTALYVVWAGANDYLGGSAIETTQPIANLTHAITQLVEAGATQILVANLPDLGTLPLTRNTERAARLSTLTQQHNAQLAAMMEQLQQQFGADVDLIPLDVNTLFDAAIANPARYGFANVNTACLAVRCSNPDDYLFWDQLHPSTAAHQQIAALARSALQPDTAPVTEANPALVIGGLLLGMVASVLVIKFSNSPT